MTSFALELQELSKQFSGHYAVDKLSLRINHGEFYALLGPNGAGKTTCLRMIAGLLKPDYGDALIIGHSITHQGEQAKRTLAYLPDDPMLYDKLLPGEYLEFVAGLWGIRSDHAAAHAQELLEWLDLWGNRNQRIEEFSRGMKQKLALAGALIHDPELMILDEPLTGLDAAAARQVKDLLLDRVKQGKTVLLTTHILEVAERLAQRIGIIQKGKLIAEGTLEELRQRAGDGQSSLEDLFLELTRSPALNPAAGKTQ